MLPSFSFGTDPPIVFDSVGRDVVLTKVVLFKRKALFCSEAPAGERAGGAGVLE